MFDSDEENGNGFLAALDKGYELVRQMNEEAEEHNSSFFGKLRGEEVNINFEIALCVGKSILENEE